MLGGTPSSAGFGLALCIYSLLAAFLLTYLWTRTVLKREFQLADRELDAAVRAVVDEQSNADAAAFAVVERQLGGQEQPTLQELTEVLGKASMFARVQVYQLAESQRSMNGGASSSAVDAHRRTLPVFRALIAADKEHKYHRNHGSLGYALKDSDPPDLRGAIDSLTTAIGIRGEAASSGFSLYEWNRAVCRILTDADFGRDQPSRGPAGDQIRDDLGTAAHRLGAGLFGRTGADPAADAVGRWLELNGLTYEALRSSP